MVREIIRDDIPKPEAGKGAGEFSLSLRDKANILAFGMMAGRLYLWTLQDIQQVIVARTFLIVPTGSEVPSIALSYIGTAFSPMGVATSAAMTSGAIREYHLFEVLRPAG